MKGLVSKELELGEVKIAQSGVVVLERGWVFGEILGMETRIRFRVKKKPEGQAGGGGANLELGFQLRLLFEPGNFDTSASGRIRARHQGESIPVVKISLVQLVVRCG